MRELERELLAYESRRGELERDHLGEWVVFYGDDLIGLYPDFETAADDAINRFDSGPFLLRQVGEEVIVFAPTLVFHHGHASSSGV